MDKLQNVVSIHWQAFENFGSEVHGRAEPVMMNVAVWRRWEAGADEAVSENIGLSVNILEIIESYERMVRQTASCCPAVPQWRPCTSRG